MKGFSLVELSIVLVILGLLTGGILAGQSLIRASEIRGMTADMSRHHASIMTFRNKYNGLPGDIPNATSFWGTDADGCPSHTSWQTGKTATCNGDGSGTYNAKPEYFRAWQQLAAAGLIEGSFSGVTGPTNSGTCTSIDMIPGVNVPSLRLARGGAAVNYSGPLAPGATIYMFASEYGNTLTYGATINGCNPVGGLLVPDEAWNVDTKLDDGKPGLGRLLTRVSCAVDGCSPGCNTATTSAGATTASTAEYALGGTTRACSFYYRF